METKCLKVMLKNYRGKELSSILCAYLKKLYFSLIPTYTKIANLYCMNDVTLNLFTLMCYDSTFELTEQNNISKSYFKPSNPECKTANINKNTKGRICPYSLQLVGSLDIAIIQSVITTQAHLIFNCICLHQQWMRFPTVSAYIWWCTHGIIFLF